MSLKRRVTLIMGAVIVLMVSLNGVALMPVFRSFEGLERQEALRNSERVRNAVATELAQLARSVTDWAVWDETHDFATGQDPEYPERNLTPGSFAGLGINLFALFDPEGDLLWSAVYDLDTEEEIELSQFRSSRPADDPLVSHPDKESQATGLLMTDYGPMLLATGPVLRNERLGEIAGSLVFGRFLDPARIAELREQVRIDFELVPVDGDRDAGEGLTVEALHDRLVARDLIWDLCGRPLLQQEVNTPRDITRVGARSLELALGAMLLIGLVDLTVIWLLLRYLVLRPLTELTGHVVKIGKTAALGTRVPQNRSDELGLLAREFNRMLESLAEARRQVIEQSHRSGMANMAAGTLHNLRNGLTPMVGRIDALAAHMRESPGAELGRALKELVAPETAEERRERLRQYVELTGTRLLTMRDEAVAELGDIARQTRSLSDVLKSQDKYIYSNPVMEPLDVVELARDAVALLPPDVRAKASFELDPSLEALPAVMGERVTLAQIFSNLLLNAVQSVERCGRADGAVRIGGGAGTDPQGRIEVRVTDNGTGISADQLPRIFQRGYTTKPQGCGGLGLHWCAIAAANMEGRLYTEASPERTGATFHLLLRRAEQQLAAE